MTMETLLLRPMQAADQLGICRTRIYALIASGAVPSIRIGRSVRIPADGLRAWIASQTTERAGQ